VLAALSVGGAEALAVVATCMAIFGRADLVVVEVEVELDMDVVVVVVEVDVVVDVRVKGEAEAEAEAEGEAEVAVVLEAAVVFVNLDWTLTKHLNLPRPPAVVLVMFVLPPLAVPASYVKPPSPGDDDACMFAPMMSHVLSSTFKLSPVLLLVR